MYVCRDKIDASAAHRAEMGKLEEEVLRSRETKVCERTNKCI